MVCAAATASVDPRLLQNEAELKMHLEAIVKLAISRKKRCLVDHPQRWAFSW